MPPVTRVLPPGFELGTGRKAVLVVRIDCVADGAFRFLVPGSVGCEEADLRTGPVAGVCSELRSECNLVQRRDFTLFRSDGRRDDDRYVRVGILECNAVVLVDVIDRAGADCEFFQVFDLVAVRVLGVTEAGALVEDD